MNIVNFANGKLIKTLVSLIYKRNENGFTVCHKVNIGFVKDVLSVPYEEELSKL